METVVQLGLAGLALGSVYALLLLGILLIYRVSKAVNFSQGQVGMISAFVAFWMYDSFGLPPWVALLVGLALAVLTAYLTERLLLRPLQTRPAVAGQDLVVTLAVLLLLTAVAETLLGTQAQTFLSLGNDVQFGIGTAIANLNQIAVLAFVILILLGFAAFLRLRPGAAMIASATNPQLARMFAVNVNRVASITWAVSGLTAGLAGFIIASRLSVNPYYMTPFLISAFVAGIIGGLDRFVAPLLVAFGLAMFQTWVIYVFGASASTIAIFVLILLLLAVLPRRFLVEGKEARA